MSSKMIRIVPVRTPESSSLTGAPKQDNNWGNKSPRFDPVRLISTSRPFRLRLLSDEMKNEREKNWKANSTLRLSLSLSLSLFLSPSLPFSPSLCLSPFLSLSLSLSLSLYLSLSSSLPLSLSPPLSLSLSIYLYLYLILSISTSFTSSLWSIH